jgi:isopentenyl phosphate kinase
VFIKFGGSLITRKDTPMTARTELIERLAGEIAELRKNAPEISLVLGNGAGSFGHYKVVEHDIKAGFSGPEGAFGYADVQNAASALNRIVVHALLAKGVPAVGFQPSTMFTARDGARDGIFPDALSGMTGSGVVPVVYGDIIWDSVRGSVIFSTETVFSHLIEDAISRGNPPRLVMHLTTVPGVLDADARVIPEITPASWPDLARHIARTDGYDVTGGMKHKIESSLELTQKGITTYILDGNTEGNIAAALEGTGYQGTKITG